LIPALIVAAVLIPISRADASYSVLCTGYSSCSSKGYDDSGYQDKQGTSYWAMYTGTNCTNYVAYRLVTTNKMANKRPASGVGNARDWGTTMSSITDSTPAEGAVAWWGSAVGGNHVAYIEKVVSSTEIWVSESNWSGAFDWRKITKSGSGWPQGFIHFADPATETAPTPTPTADADLSPQAPPALAGIPTVGVEVTADPGTWSPGSDLTYTYAWYLDETTKIAGASGPDFTPTAAMLGRALSVRVTAARPGYAPDTATSDPVEVWPRSLTTLDAPTITGTPSVGSTLSVDHGEWFPWPDEYSYQWLAGGTPISGATSRTFVPGAAQKGSVLTVRLTARHPDYEPVTVDTAGTAKVAG
jgi:surface antigen